MSLTLAFTIGSTSSTLEAHGLKGTVLELGEYETTDWRDGKTKITEEYYVLEFAKSRIVETSVRRDVRIMSDVWADCYDCVIALDDGKFLEFSYGCSESHFVMGRFTRCEVDAPELKDAYHAWRKEKLEREAAERWERDRPMREAAEERAKKDAARKAKKEASLAASRAAAEQQLAAAPQKGVRVRVGDKTGEVFWRGVTAHRGKFSARLGVRWGRGREDVVWCEASEASAVATAA